MRRWAFHLQIYFLNNRYRQLLEILAGSQTVIQDRTIYEDAYIFAPNLHDMGLMEKRDFENYRQLFELMSSQVQPPDLLIYLKAGIPTLVDHIEKRGRDYEGSMSLDYLKRLNERYDEWIKSYHAGPLLIINADDIDFDENPEDMGTRPILNTTYRHDVRNTPPGIGTLWRQAMLQLYEAGQRIFGENRPQELRDKRQLLPDDIAWHLIGHLQSNKIKYVVGQTELIHSIDSFKLLRQVNDRAQRRQTVQDCLLPKFGFHEEELQEVLQKPDFHALSHVRICGLMGLRAYAKCLSGSSKNTLLLPGISANSPWACPAITKSHWKKEAPWYV